MVDILLRRIQRLRSKAKATGGYGLALLMVFIASAVLIGTSFQLVSTPATIAYVGTSSQSNLAARELAMAGMAATETDIRSKLDASQSITTSYRYPTVGSNTIYAPSDPTNLASAGTAIGTYYATVPYARGNTIMVTVTATVGAATTSYSQLMTVSKVTVTPPYDCSVVENQVLAGNITSVADADLIAYAQNNCMVKTGSVNVTTPSAGSGTTGCGTYSGSGTISFATMTTTCSYDIQGTYTTVQLYSTTSANNSATIFTNPSSVITRTINVPGAVSDYISFLAENSSTSALSTSNHNFYFNSAATTNSFVVEGGNGNDVISFNGSANVDIYTNKGTDTVIVKGTWGKAADGDTMELGYPSINSTNYVYIDTIQADPSNGNSIQGVGTGPNYIYFNKINGGGSVNLLGGSGNDIIGCGVGFNGAAAACNATQVAASDGMTYLEGQGGNDIISLDANLPGGMAIYGETGHNIAYTKGCSASSAIYINDSGGVSGLVISGGNRSCLIQAYSTGSVLLKKSGTSDSGTNSGFTRTLTY